MTQFAAKSGYAAALGLGLETTFGTAVAPTIYLPIESATASPTNKLISRSPIRRSKSEQIAGFGSFVSSGQLEMRAEPVTLAEILGYVLGKDTVTASTDTKASIHTFTMTNSGQPTATVSVDYGTGSTYKFTGAKFESLDLSCKAGDDLMVKTSFQNQSMLIAAGSLSPTFTSETPFEWGFITSSTFDGTNFDATDFQVSVKMNNKPMYTATSGRLARGINELGAQVTGKFTYPLADDSMNTALLGAANAPATGKPSGHTVVLTFTHPDVAATGGTDKYKVTVTLNNVILQGAPIPLSMKNEIMQQVSFVAAESAPGAGDAIQVAVVTGASATYPN